MSEEQKRYKMRLIPSEGVLEVWTTIWYAIYETPCYLYCTDVWRHYDQARLGAERDNITMREAYDKNIGYIKLKKIDKRSDRFAQETPELALDKLKWLKRKQLKHMEREAVFINKFLECEQLDDYGDECQRVPDSVDLVCRYYNFN